MGPLAWTRGVNASVLSFFMSGVTVWWLPLGFIGILELLFGDMESKKLITLFCCYDPVFKFSDLKNRNFNN
jgi:hypothetical protein